MKRIKQPIALLLILSIIASLQIIADYTGGIEVLAAEPKEEPKYEIGMDKIRVSNGIMGVYAPEIYNVSNPNADTSAKAWDILKSSGQLPEFVTSPYVQVGGKKYGFNFKLWNDKHIVVYGKATDVGVNPRLTAVNGYKDWKTKKDDPTCGEYYLRGSERGEYRYHGYDASGNLYSNTSFPIDGIGKNMNEYKWIYKPWNSDIVRISDWNRYTLQIYDYFIRQGKQPTEEAQKLAEWISKGFYKDEADIKTKQPITTLDWSNAEAPNDLSGAVSSYNGRLAYNYANVMSAPTTLYPGEAKMWIKAQDGTYRYRTAFIPAFGDKLKKGEVSAEIVVLTNEMQDISIRDWDDSDDYKKHLNETKKVELQVISTLPDKDIFNDPIKKTIYFNRNDMVAGEDAWRINLTDKTNLGGVPNASWDKKSPYYVDWQGDGNAHGRATFTITMKVSDIIRAYKEGKTGIEVSYKATARFYSKENKSEPTEISSSVYTYHIPFEVKEGPPPPPPPPPKEEIEEEVDPPDFINPDVYLPEPAFDIVPYKPEDRTEYKDAKGGAVDIVSKKVYVDGDPVSYDEFFSGEFVFGECGYDRLANIIVVYTASDGSVSYTSRWIRVLNTKPRVQFIFSGDYKQNRKQSVENTSPLANTKEVIETYPIVKYEWTVEAVGGGASNTAIKSGTLTDMYREFTFKEPGSYRITLVGTNTLGRVSDPYVLDFEILPDTPPAVICELNNVSVARGETIKSYFFESVSTDGDSIESTTVQLYHDADNDGEPETLLKTWNNVSNGEFPEYTVSKLGMYRFKITSKEKMHGSFIDGHVTAADAQVKVIERDFWVDNYVPQTDIYTDVPMERAQVDVYILTDSQLAQQKIDHVKNGRMDLNNYLRMYNFNPVVEHWDLKTYTYSQSASTTRNTGTDYPPSSVYYSSGGYSGTLSRTSVSDNGSYQDFGHYEEREESKTATSTASGYNYNYYKYTNGSWVETGSSGSDTPTISYSDADGFTGTLEKRNVEKTYDSGVPSGEAEEGATYTRVRYYTAYYSGTVTRKVQYWVSDWQWVPNYTGFYSGTIYKYVKAPYIDPFRATSEKYVIYISDGKINDMPDLQSVLSKSGAKLVLIGSSAAASQVSSVKYIPVTGDISADINNALNFIVETIPKKDGYYVLAGVDTIDFKVDDFDQEKDLIVEAKFLYVQDANYFDNTQGLDSFAVPEFSQTSGWTTTKATKLNKVGKYNIYRRIKDQPSTDPRFAGYSYYSGTPYITIYAHRKPIALAELQWTFDKTTTTYNTTWVDKSYDLDHQYSRADKGIVERKIKFRQVGADWNYYIPAKLSPGNYELEYYVKDVEGVWSDPFRMNFTLLANPAPTVDATPTSADWTNANVTCTITASDPSGDYAYTNYMWSTSTTKPTSGWTMNTAGTFNVTQSTQGVWYLHMEAFDYGGNRFYRMRGPYKIDKTPPSAVFNPNSASWRNTNVNVVIDPSDTGGSGIKQWRYRKSTDNGSTYGEWSNYVTGDTNWTVVVDTTGLNKIQAEIQDNAGNIGYVTSGTYYIDKIAPTITANPTTLESTNPVTVAVTSVDTGGSRLKQTNYRWSTTAAKPTSGWSTSTAGSFTTSLTIENVVHYLHVEAFDNAGNSTYRVFGPYIYNPVKITSVTISGYWNHWRGQTDLLGKRMTNEPHRFLSLEKVRIEVTTIGSPEKIEVRFSPELEAMMYVDPKGNRYDYREMVGYYVGFPYQPAVNENKAVWEYILPLAPSTKDWDNNVLRSPYWMKVTAYKGSSSDTYMITDINITGNVYDLIYIQPVD